MLTILIVDDNPSFCAQAARLCEREGFTAVTAGSVSELAGVLTGPLPDLVLIDIELPQIPGHRLGTLIRSRGRVPIVLVSALSEDRIRRLFEASDADGWICKPLTRDKLIGAVTRFVTTASKPLTASPVKPAVTSAPSELIRVLLIEDEALITARIESVLGTTCSLTTVTDGDAAIHHVLSEDYDCILLDLMLPHLSGFDVLRHLILRKPELLKATVIMTAATDESLQFIDRNSVAEVLRKPFPVASLAGIVARVAAK
ncbi:MAG TPA: response regulator [Thermoanaerobaculia bacterium]|nr:response regulator [Thermoanaerobaculia bacterium]